MSGKIIKKGSVSQEEIINGVIKAADAIKTTLGPSGRCVAISNSTIAQDPEITRDGATVAKSISFNNQGLNMGAALLRKAASLTESQAGDGTSTTSVLIKELCERGRSLVKDGVNVNEIKSGMLKASSWVKSYIAEKAIPIENDLEKIRRVATISANNDPVIGDLIVSSMEQVGIEGTITADLGASLDTTIEVTAGMKINRGWLSPSYVTSQADAKCELSQPAILVINERLSSIKQLFKLITPVAEQGKSILIICDEIDEVVNAALAYNTQMGAVRACVVKGIDYGDNRKNIMNDVAIVVGAKFICPENNLTFANVSEVGDTTVFGTAEKVVVTKDSTIIYKGHGNEDEIKKQASIIKARLEDPTISSYDKNKFTNRLASLVGGISVIRAGGATEAEKVNLRATIEDAILASKSAIEEGVVPGSGYVYFKASKEIVKDKKFWKSLTGDEKYGVEILISSLPSIMKTVADNSREGFGVSVLETVGKSTGWGNGYNAKTHTYSDLIKDGVLDSAKVIRVALENAVSTASMILLIDCSIIDEEDETDGEGCCGCHCHNN